MVCARLLSTNRCHFGTDIKQHPSAKAHETILPISYLQLDDIREGVHLNRIEMHLNCAPWKCGVFEQKPCTRCKCGVFEVYHGPHVWEDMQGHGNNTLSRFMTISCGNDIIPWNIPHTQSAYGDYSMESCRSHGTLLWI